VIEVRRVVHENSLVYSKMHCCMGHHPELKHIHNTGQTPGTEVDVCLTQAAAWDLSPQLYGTTPVTEILYVLLRPLPGTKVLLWRWEKTAFCKKLVLLPSRLQINPKSSDSS
jgi:hypothetical protein